MSKKILIITSSLRKNSNSDKLAEAFSAGAEKAGKYVETISLKGKNIAFCKGCMACQKTGKCVIEDDAIGFAEKIKNVDTVVFAAPVYYYSMPGQLKTMLDRCNSLFSAEYSFRDIYLLATAAEDEKNAVDGTVKGIQGWTDCFEYARLAAVVFAGGVNEAGEIEGHPALKEAYEMGALA